MSTKYKYDKELSHIVKEFQLAGGKTLQIFTVPPYGFMSLRFKEGGELPHRFKEMYNRHDLVEALANEYIESYNEAFNKKFAQVEIVPELREERNSEFDRIFGAAPSNQVDEEEEDDFEEEEEAPVKKSLPIKKKSAGRPKKKK